MMKNLLAFSAFVLWAAIAYGQELTFTVGGGSSLTARTGSKLGLIYAHQANGLTVGTGTANVAVLNAWSAEINNGGDNKLPLDFKGRIAMAGASPWTLPAADGVTITTNGGSDVRAEYEYETPSDVTLTVQGGMPTEYVWVDHGNLAGPMIVLPGYRGELGVMTIKGNSGGGTRNQLIADSANRKAIGIQLNANPNGYGVGEYAFRSLCPQYCVIGMLVSPTPQHLGGEECRYDFFGPEYCDVGFSMRNRDALIHNFRYAIQANTPICWHYESCGALVVDTYEAGTDSAQYGLLITAEDADDGADDDGANAGDDNAVGGYHFKYIWIDNNAADAYQIIHIDPTLADSRGGVDASAHSSANTTINFIANHVSDVTGSLLWMKNNYGVHRIGGGENLPTGLVHVEGGTAGVNPTVIVECGSFINGVDLDNIRNLFDVSSRGVVDVVLRDCHENSGGFYNDFKGRIDILTDTTYDVLSGGYVTAATYQTTPP